MLFRFDRRYVDLVRSSLDAASRAWKPGMIVIYNAGVDPVNVVTFDDPMATIAAREDLVRDFVQGKPAVFTLAGGAEALQTAILSLVEAAIAAIDLREHRGVHPRIGAVDVIPFVPLAGATMPECVALATNTAAIVAERFGVPVFLYEEAAAAAHRRRLDQLRAGGLPGLTTRMREDASWRPDFGPRQPHPRAGVLAVGARLPLEIGRAHV